LNENCVNRDFSKMRIGGSRHAVMLDEDGWLAGSSVLVRIAEDRFRFYSLYSLFPVIMSGAYDVQMMPLNRFIFQVDGPKSLQIIESAFKADFHDLKFAQNKYVDVDGDEIFVHRLGMSGALAYEIQGDESAADKVFDLVVEAGKKLDMKTLGIRQYMCGGVTLVKTVPFGTTIRPLISRVRIAAPKGTVV
ncbi:MAG: hypothetical protein Q4D48_09865, partial [Coriobacteriales bacterium]|nr:hypothetical protein [Coriobacteriales bacterium]